MLFKLLTSGFKVLNGKFVLPLIAKAEIAISVSPALTGVGYILGIRIASVMVGGAALSALIIIPLINWFGAGLTEPFYPETEHLIRDMSAHDIWNRYVRYIGAGAVACGGFITLIKSIPTMIESFRVGFAQIRERPARTRRERAHRPGSIVQGRDRGHPGRSLSCLTVVPGVLGFIDSIPVVRLAAALLIGIFAFFFVTVSSRIVGLVGVTSNPTSGMTIATLLGTSLIFAAAGWTDTFGKATALMVGTVGVYRGVDRRRHVAGPQDRIRSRCDTEVSANRRTRRCRHLGGRRRLDDRLPAPERSGHGWPGGQRTPGAAVGADEAGRRRRARRQPPLDADPDRRRAGRGRRRCSGSRFWPSPWVSTCRCPRWRRSSSAG